MRFAFGMIVVLALLAYFGNSAPVKKSSVTITPSALPSFSSTPSLAVDSPMPRKWAPAPAPLPIVRAVAAVSEPAPDSRGEYRLDGIYVPSGWMGDAADARNCKGVLTVSACNAERFTSAASMQYVYRPEKGAEGWCAVGYQHPANNWGTKPGINYSGKKIRRLAFEVKGATGNEVVIFKSGGGTPHDARYPASYGEIAMPATRLTKHFKVYEIDLGADVDLRNVVCPFTVAFERDLNPEGAVFWIADIKFLAD